MVFVILLLGVKLLIDVKYVALTYVL